MGRDCNPALRWNYRLSTIKGLGYLESIATSVVLNGSGVGKRKIAGLAAHTKRNNGGRTLRLDGCGGNGLVILLSHQLLLLYLSLPHPRYHTIIASHLVFTASLADNANSRVALVDEVD